MNISNRTFTYPVLSAELSSYKSSYFFSSITCALLDANIIRITVEIKLDNEEINTLVHSGMAEFIIHLECSVSSFRKIYRTSDNTVYCDIPVNSITDHIDILVLVVSKKEIDDFFSTDFSEIYENKHFFIQKNSILAYENFEPIIVKKNYENFEKVESIFKICKNVIKDKNTKKYIQFSCEQQYIRIYLNEDEYAIYANLYKNPKYQNIINSMIVLPALTHALSILQFEDNYETMKTQLWYLSLEKAYKALGTGSTIIDKLINQGEQPYLIAQEIMDYPINKGFSSLLTVEMGK